MAPPLFSRRSALLLAGGLLIAPRALAASGLRFPLTLAYVRVGPKGFMPLRLGEQQAWETMALRTGQLISTIEPLQPTNMLQPAAPELDGGASCALAARRMASDAGFSHVIMYGIDDGKSNAEGWVAQCFASLRSGLGGAGRASGEAHLLDVAGGMPVLSATADAKARGMLNPFDRRNPAGETLTALTLGVERRLQAMARAEYELHKSIAD
jgi:hypothetical protein